MMGTEPLAARNVTVDAEFRQHGNGVLKAEINRRGSGRATAVPEQQTDRCLFLLRIPRVICLSAVPGS